MSDMTKEEIIEQLAFLLKHSHDKDPSKLLKVVEHLIIDRERLKEMVFNQACRVKND